MNRQKTDVVIVGTGVGGLYAALNLPREKQILMITKDEIENSDSYLAQGGICVLPDDKDFDSFLEDTLKAGHYENRRDSVEVMIRSSRDIIKDLISYGVDFARGEKGELLYTREGAHSRPRILYHEDITGQEIVTRLLEQVQKRPNVKILEHVTMLDIIMQENCCCGIIAADEKGMITAIEADDTIWACGGIGGLYEHSTNFPHLTGDALAISLKHGIELEHVDYVQIHPTTLYSQKKGRRFLISESVRGEGAYLYNAAGERFTNEVLPRDCLTQEVHKQMEKDKKPYVWLDMTPLGRETILRHFPNIYRHCLEEGYDVTKDRIPVVPAQHYFMGGVRVDLQSKTSADHLYAVGETSCNGVHGANRLASNSLLESLVFAKRAAGEITKSPADTRAGNLHKNMDAVISLVREADYADREGLKMDYKNRILEEMEKEKDRV